MEDPTSQKSSKTLKYISPHNFFQEKYRQEKLTKIFSDSFKPLIDSALKKYSDDNYKPIIKKIDEKRLQALGKKSEFEIIQEKFFRKNSISNSPKGKKEPRIQKKTSFLIENNIINKNEIMTIPDNKKFVSLIKAETSTEKEFYEREKNLMETYNNRKEKLRTLREEKELEEMKNVPKIDSKSIKILKENNLDNRKPIYLRSEEIKEEKRMKIISLKKEIERERNYTTITTQNNSYNKLKSNDISNIDYNSNNSKLYTSPYETGHKRSLSSNADRAKSNNFSTWYKQKEIWNENKKKKTEHLKAQRNKENLNQELKETTFAPNIDDKSRNMILSKNEEEQNLTIFDKLYNLKENKKEKIQLLEQKYKPIFKPKINKNNNIFSTSSILNTRSMRSFYIEEKENDYINFESDYKNKESRITNDKNKTNGNLYDTYSNGKKNTNGNRQSTKDNKAMEEYFSRISKDYSPNKA